MPRNDSHRTRNGLLAALCAAAATGVAGIALADPVCGERETMLRTLAERYHEAPRSMGLSDDGSMVEVLSSPSGSWTIVLTRPDGLSCLMVTGDGWENLPQMAEGPKV